jgi:hypothetical protein
VDKRLVTCNAVVVAKQLAPSILSQLWLVRNGLVREEELAQGCIFTPDVVQVVTKEYNLLALSNRIQFSPLRHGTRTGAMVQDHVGKIVSAMSDTPYTAVGLNMNWHVLPGTDSFAAAMERLAAPRGSSIFGAFDTPDARYGAYFSRDALGFRVKLDIKPINLANQKAGGETGPEGFQFGFNFEQKLQDAGAEAVTVILEQLSQWDAARRFCNETMALIES